MAATCDPVATAAMVSGTARAPFPLLKYIDQRCGRFDHGVGMLTSAEALGGMDKGDTGLAGAALIHDRVADIDGSFQPVSPGDQGDVPGLSQTG